MRAIRGKNTRPELLVRDLLESDGYSLTGHVKGLPGKPDILLRRHRTALFIQGCFWHGHNCHLFKWPKTRADFWLDKIEANKQRDAIARNVLIQQGWRVVYIWECALKGRLRKPPGQAIAEIAALIHADPIVTFGEITSEP